MLYSHNIIIICINYNAVINNNNWRLLQDPILVFTIPMCTRNNLFIYRQFRHAPSKSLASSSLECCKSSICFRVRVIALCKPQLITHWFLPHWKSHTVSQVNAHLRTQKCFEILLYYRIYSRVIYWLTLERNWSVSGGEGGFIRFARTPLYFSCRRYCICSEQQGMRGFIFLPRKVVKSLPSVRFLFGNPLFVNCVRLNCRVVQSAWVVWVYTTVYK
jgi:hypothetical protein